MVTTLCLRERDIRAVSKYYKNLGSFYQLFVHKNIYYFLMKRLKCVVVGDGIPGERKILVGIHSNMKIVDDLVQRIGRDYIPEFSVCHD